MKTLKSLSVLTAAVLSNSLSLNAASDAANKPNFVIIFCDDMGYGDLSCYGNPTIRTPNIDRMACEGMKLTQFYVGAGVSTPSRAALMTGRLPVRNGLYGDRVAVLFPNSKAGLGQDEVTIAKVLGMTPPVWRTRRTCALCLHGSCLCAEQRAKKENRYGRK